MNNCCSTRLSHGKQNKRYRCPVNGRKYREVSIKTIMHHVKQPWQWIARDQAYYFCDDPECSVVYFGDDDSVIEKKDVRTRIGLKQKGGDAQVCYCFGVSVNDAVTQPSIKTFVIEKTRDSLCECETRNPSGRCCLKDFPAS